MMQEVSDIPIVPMNADECTEFKNPISAAVSCTDENISTLEDLPAEKNEGTKLNGVASEYIPDPENASLERDKGAGLNSITPENIPTSDDAGSRKEKEVNMSNIAAGNILAPEDVVPGKDEDTVLDNIAIEKLKQLMTEVEKLKADQLKFQNEQEQWSTLMQERDNCQKEIQELRSHLVKTDDQWQDKMSKLKIDHEAKTNKLQKERDSMVVKYARSEREVIVAQNQREGIEKKIKDLTKEREGLQEKIKSLTSEKTRVCHMLDVKCNEYFGSQREAEKLKDELNLREGKVRWGQNKLKSECESHKETQTKYEKSIQQIKQLKEEMEELKKYYNELKAKEGFNGKTEAQLLEEKARLIVDKQNMEEQSIAYKNILKEFETLKTSHTRLSEEKNTLSTKIQALLKERSDHEQSNSHLKEQVSQQRESLIQLQTKLAELNGVYSQLENERERLSKNQEELENIRQTNSDLEHDMERCRAKENELLEFTGKLTEKNVNLQSDHTALRERARFLEEDEENRTKKVAELEFLLKNCQLELQDEKENRARESSAWCQNISDKSRLCEDLQTQVRELQNELASVRRKHTVNMKELTRELRTSKKRLEQSEASSSSATGTIHASDITSLGSRTSSNTSINTIGIDHHSPAHSPPPPPSALHEPADWEPNVLMEKMLRVQRDNAKKSEKIDFMEEHIHVLVAELKKKNRIVQAFLMKEDSGIMASEASDKHKAEMAKHGGIMSSMYSSKSLDEGLSLELSMEINKKLQGLLEDTLLKNMTLKDNLSTLGAEVARITQQYQTLLQQQQQKQKQQHQPKMK